MLVHSKFFADSPNSDVGEWELGVSRGDQMLFDRVRGSRGLFPRGSDLVSDCGNGWVKVEESGLSLRASLENGVLSSIHPTRLSNGDILSSVYAGKVGPSALLKFVPPSSMELCSSHFHRNIRLVCCSAHVVVLSWTLESSTWQMHRAVSELKFIESQTRETGDTKTVKLIYQGRCQRCCVVLDTPAGRVCEAAHVKPHAVGGPARMDNLLCLCPNCHETFDHLGWFLTKCGDDVMWLDSVGARNGRLTLVAGHTIADEYLEYRCHMSKTDSGESQRYQYLSAS